MNYRSLALVFAMTATAAAGARAQDTATVPAWTAKLEQKQTWKIEQVRERSRSSFPERWEEARGAFVQHATVIGKTLTGYSVNWEFEPLDESLNANLLQKGIMAVYGVEKLSIGIDPAGRPLIAYGAEQRDQQVEAVVANLPADREGDGRLLTQFRSHAADDPLFEVQLFAKPAIMIGRLQRGEPWTARKGDTFRLQQTDHLYDVPVTDEVLFTVDDVDVAGRRVTISWDWTIAAERLPISMQSQLSAMLAPTAAQAAIVPLPLRGEAGTARFAYKGKAQISLDDGSLLSAEEERALRIAFETEYLTTRMSREAAK